MQSRFVGGVNARSLVNDPVICKKNHEGNKILPHRPHIYICLILMLNWNEPFLKIKPYKIKLGPTVVGELYELAR